MPLPIGHTAIGLAAAETIQGEPSSGSRIEQFIFITVLANLPDIDTLIGLFLQGNGDVYHRGPTHSLLFALVAGYAASNAWRLWQRIPRFGFQFCSLLIFSHVAADMLLTASPVSLIWPLESNPGTGHSGWLDVMNMVLFDSFQDIGIVFVVIAYLLLLRIVRSGRTRQRLFAVVKKWGK